MATDLRKVVYQGITQAPYIEANQIVVEAFGRISPPTPKRPFVIYKFGEMTSAVPPTMATEMPLDIWVHDEPGDYARIDETISAIEAALLALDPNDSFYAIMWNGRSGDLIDPEWATILRICHLQLYANQP